MSPFARLNPLGTLTLGVLGLTLASAAVMLRPLLAEPPAATTDAAAPRPRDPAAAARKFQESTDRHVAMIEGRSLFAIPPEPEAVVDEGPKATVYAGPQLIAYINNTAYFSDGQKISPSRPRSTSLELIRADPPWSVRVRWEGGEFDVDLFRRVPLSTLNEPLKAWSSTPIPVPPSSDDTPRLSTTPRDAPPGPGAVAAPEPQPAPAAEPAQEPKPQEPKPEEPKPEEPKHEEPKAAEPKPSEPAPEPQAEPAPQESKKPSPSA